MKNALPSPGEKLRKAPNSAGFSLVETAMAVGIAGFVLLTVIGLQPVGLMTLRSSMDSTIETQIVKQISGEIGLTAFSQIDAFAQKPFYFDTDGKRVDSAGDSRYQVKVTVVPFSESFSPFPSAPADIDNDLKTVRLEIQTSPGAASSKMAEQNRRVHTFHVARSDKLTP